MAPPPAAFPPYSIATLGHAAPFLCSSACAAQGCLTDPTKSCPGSRRSYTVTSALTPRPSTAVCHCHLPRQDNTAAPPVASSLQPPIKPLWPSLCFDTVSSTSCPEQSSLEHPSCLRAPFLPQLRSPDPPPIEAEPSRAEPILLPRSILRAGRSSSQPRPSPAKHVPCRCRTPSPPHSRRTPPARFEAPRSSSATPLASPRH